MADRILLAEDTRDLNRALVAVLEHQGYEVDAVYDGKEALAHAQTQHYDCVVLDIMMPKLDGLKVLTHMREDGDYTPVLLLTAKVEIDDRVVGLDAGADDYLAKPFAMKELLARLRSLTRRRGEYAANCVTYEDITLNGQTFELSAGNAVRLSVKEFELMQVLVANAGHGMTSARLLGRVWRQEADADEDTVRLYVSYLRGKLKWVGSHVTIGEQADGFSLQRDES